MDPTVIIGMLSTAVGTLFAALVLALRQRGDDWKEMYIDERRKHEQTAQKASEDNRENSIALRELADFIHGEIGRTRQEWGRSSAGRQR